MALKLPTSTERHRADRTYGAPQDAGIYAWYFEPVSRRTDSRQEMSSILSRLIASRFLFSINVSTRYGMQLVFRDRLQVRIGNQEKEPEQFISETVELGGHYFVQFLQTSMSPIFARPLYVGITNNLRRRLYEEHFLQLCNYWDDLVLAKYLESRPAASVDSSTD